MRGGISHQDLDSSRGLKHCTAKHQQVIDRGVSHDMNSSHATHSSGSEKGSGKCVDSGHASFATPTAAPSQACPRINLSQDVSPTASLVDGIATQAPALLPSGGDGLEAWFAVHFTRLSESGDQRSCCACDVMKSCSRLCHSILIPFPD